MPKIEVTQIKFRATAEDPIPHWVAVLDHGSGPVYLKLPARVIPGDSTGDSQHDCIDAIERVANALLNFAESERAKLKPPFG